MTKKMLYACNKRKPKDPGRVANGKSDNRGQYGDTFAIEVFPNTRTPGNVLDTARGFSLWITCGHVDKAVDKVCITMWISLWISFFIM